MNSNVSSNEKSAELIEGYEYPVCTFRLDEKDLAAYLEATHDTVSNIRDLGTVPPLAVAARALAELSRNTISPPGTVHSSQEFDFKKASTAGERLELNARVEKKLDRGDLHLLTTVLNILDGGRETIMTARITVACRTAQARWWYQE